MIAHPKPIQFDPDELDIIADCLRDYQAARIRDELRSDATIADKKTAARKWHRADNALRKVRAA